MKGLLQNLKKAVEIGEVRCCKACGKEKPLSEFPLNGSGYILHTCRLCFGPYQRLHAKKYRERHPLRRKESQRHWAKLSADRRRFYQLKKLYGLTREQYDKIASDQGGLCAICRNEFTVCKSRSPVPHVDHCHKTDVVRGLLCGACNNGLGHFKDSVELLRQAADYLDKSKK